MEARDDAIVAIVRGGQDFVVRLTSDDGIIDYTCECSGGAVGPFCKHCVAAALAWLSRQTASSKTPAKGKSKKLTLADAGKILQDEDKETILQLLLDWAKQDSHLKEQLILYAARRSGPDSEVEAVRRSIVKAVRRGRSISYREAGSWARGVNEAITEIEHLLNRGNAAAVIELCESTLRSLMTVIQSVDDSNGHFAILRDRLQQIHFKACTEARPDPVELASRLFAFEMDGNFDVFYDAAKQYASILGDEGMRAYRRLAEAEWAKVAEQTTELRSAQRIERFTITRIMEWLARSSGDTGQLVAVMKCDLSSSYSYLQIAEVYREANQHDEALIWAERGLQAFPDRADPRLVGFVTKELHRRNRHEDAVKLAWTEFLRRPFTDAYRTLQGHAEQAGDWPAWRERALAEVRSRIDRAKANHHPSQPRWMSAAVDASPLVEIFLYEQNTDAAWEAARTGGCSNTLWLRLAAARATEHPEQAAPIYLKQAENILAARSNGSYEDSVELLETAAAVMQTMGKRDEFIDRLEQLRVKYKAKRNFIKLVEQNRAVLYGE